MSLVHEIVLPVLLLALAGCEKSPVNRYASRAQADTAGAVDRGWVPNFVPESASDIVESHDVEANQARVEFTVPADELDLMVARGALLPLPKSFGRAVSKAISVPRWSSLGSDDLEPFARCGRDEGSGFGFMNHSTGRVHYLEPARVQGLCTRELAPLQR
jgi:hypothetical protein